MLEHRSQGRSPGRLLDHERLPGCAGLIGEAGIQDGGDVRVGQTRGLACLLLEARPQTDVAADGGVEELDRHATVEPNVQRRVDRGATPLAEALPELVTICN